MYHSIGNFDHCLLHNFNFLRRILLSSIVTRNEVNTSPFGFESCFSIACPVYAENDSLKLNEDYKSVGETTLYRTTVVVVKQTLQKKNTIYFIRTIFVFPSFQLMVS